MVADIVPLDGYQGDDSLSIYPTTETVSSVDGAKITIPAVCSPDPMDEPVVGDELGFFNESFVYMGTAKVLAASGAFCASTLSLTLDHAIAGLNASDSLLDLTQQPSARYLVHDNAMHDCRCHGVLVDASYGSIDPNLFYRNSVGAVQLAGGSGYGPGATNLSLAKNFVGDPGQWTQYYGAISIVAPHAVGSIIGPPVYRKIRIQDNLIQNTPGPAILLTSTRDFRVARNFIIDSNQAQGSPEDYGDLSTLDSVLIYQASDGTVCGIDRFGRATGLVGTDATDSNVLVAPYCR